LRGNERLATQHAVLIGKREAHDFELVPGDGAFDLARRAFLIGGPEAMAGDEVGSGSGFARRHQGPSCPRTRGRPKAGPSINLSRASTSCRAGHPKTWVAGTSPA